MSSNPALNEARDTFFAESREMLQVIEDTLLALESNAADDETINALFRAAHTIKGSAGLFDFERIVRFTHVVESVLQRVRDGAIRLLPPLVSLLLVCGDQIAALLAEAEADTLAKSPAPHPNTDAHGAELVAQLNDYLAPAAAGGALLRTADPIAEPVPAAHGGVASEHWHISVRFGPDVLRNGMDPLSFVRYLGSLGRLISVSTVFDGMPDAATMDPETCYLGFEIALMTDADRQTIADAFEFVRDDCALRILPPHSKLAEYVQLIAAMPEDDIRLGELLVRSGSLTEAELAAGLSAQGQRRVPGEAPPQLGEILLGQQSVEAPVLNAALDKQLRVRERVAQESRFVRVRADKLDQLINLVGELVVASAGVNLRALALKDAALQEATASLTHLVEQIRDDALQLRMVQLAETFNRFNRIVRDTARELGKEIELQIEGGDTELDKTMVEKLADPLMHLVRNAIDHGIEAPEVRAAAGKPRCGTLTLAACHDSGSIVITVRDDGAGLSRERLLKKGIERGLVAPGDQLSDSEVFNLIFAPGFSTAQTVTELSGRGVGMDVVKRNIQALRGVVSLGSEPGRGTTVTMRLPLTLAIIDGFLVGVAGAMFVVPQELVIECIEAPALDLQQDYLNLRGEVLPFLRLDQMLGSVGEPVATRNTRRSSVVVVRTGSGKAGLLVDSLHGEFHTVIKPLGKLFQNIRGVSDATILGNGEVALVLDVSALVGSAATRLQGGTVPAHGSRALAQAV
ncbi:chemotaxis protein CheA [Niveibacterium sp. 24ML]|uniref:chemotaxis protein CheA n=1 Tax=Niveibacterium sp. 24ML TaxID=2985512 RepID=UPI00226D541C|nr:chemotaxis protein CheA [Niveibacterium sp. 24ML]MCX9154739.1 chemotaxis protein CheA [Niveibacterium sp. 24ML]